MTSYQTVRVDVANFVATVTMARPPVNALNLQLCRDIGAAFGDIRDAVDEIRVVVLTGEGTCFCAGRDTKVAGQEPKAERARALSGAMSSIYHTEVPVIAAVNGPAIGAGFRMALQCDLILATSGAVFSMPEVDLGLNPSIATMLRGLNQFQSREIAFTGRRYTAAELAAMGLMREVADLDELTVRVRSLATDLAAKSSAALRAAKWSANGVELLFNDFETVHRTVEARI